MLPELTTAEYQQLIDECAAILDAAHAPKPREVSLAERVARLQEMVARHEQIEAQPIPVGAEKEAPIQVHVAADLAPVNAWDLPD